MASKPDVKNVQVKILVSKAMARDWRRKARMKGVSVGELVRSSVEKVRA